MIVWRQCQYRERILPHRSSKTLHSCNGPCHFQLQIGSDECWMKHIPWPFVSVALTWHSSQSQPTTASVIPHGSPAVQAPTKSLTEKGVITKGFLFAGGISRISRVSRFSKKSLDSPLFSTLSRVSRVSKFSRKWTFLKNVLSQLTSPDFFGFQAGRARENPVNGIWAPDSLVVPWRVTATEASMSEARLHQ